MTAAPDFSFDGQVAAGAADPTSGGAVPVELPADQQRYGMLWPGPADMVSDHSAEGAPWLPAARDIPVDPPMGPLWTASHDGPSVPATSNNWQRGPLADNHRGRGRALPAANGRPNIGRPFTVDQGSSEVRHLATDQWDPTGKRVSPADAPSAPHEIYGSQHDTTPRFIPFQVGALFDNVADSNQFTVNPGYWGVQGAMPDMAPRPQGAVAAQQPSDPYVAAAVGGMPAPVQIDYEMEF
jgi:hypothetical protein